MQVPYNSGIKRSAVALAAAIILATLADRTHAQEPVGSGFTYQAELLRDGQPVNDTCDLTFSLWDAAEAGAQIGSDQQFTQYVEDVFSVTLDFGSDVFDDEARWIEIDIRCPAGGGAFTTLTPRQRITSTPHSISTRGIDVDANGNVETQGAIKGVKMLASAFASTSPLILEAPAGVERARIDDTTGYFGINKAAPLAGLHLEAAVSLGLTPSDFFSEEDILVEAGRAWLGLHSSDQYTIGSGINLAEHDTSAGAADFWSIYRPAQSGNLNFTFGSSLGPTLNTTMLQLTSDGDFKLFGAAGDSSVQLPDSAVSSSELADEPGVASKKTNDLATTLNPTFTVPTVLDSRVINCPAAGYVLVIGTCQLTADHLQGTRSFYTFGVSDTGAAFPPNQDVAVTIPATEPDGNRAYPITVHGLFQVSSGAHTFMMLGKQEEGAQTSNVLDVQLTVIYFPTAYGTVEGT